MAIPSLAAMAALTLFHNPHMQPEDVSVPFGEGYSAKLGMAHGWHAFFYVSVDRLQDVNYAHGLPALHAKWLTISLLK